MGVSWANSAIRRGLDAVVAGTALVLASPIIAAIAAIVAATMGRPVTFSQHRAGRDGRSIPVLKFRTMTDGRDRDGALLPDEHRLTRTGRLLRASSLDELPQLWSVVRGDMSLIGPRPLPLAYVERYSTEQRRRLDVRPGITGWAQVNGRNALAWPEKLALDTWYVDHASPLLDAKILLRTITSVLRRDGVSADGHATMPEFMGET